MLAQTELKNNPQDADTPVVILTAQQHKFAHVRIYQWGSAWYWQRHFGGGKLPMTGNESFRSALEAAYVASVVAHCEGVPCVLPRELQADLIAQYRAQGADHYRNGHDSTVCWNVYQRQGFAAAALSATETDLMDRDLQMIRRGELDYVRMSDADMERMEAEALLTDWRG